MNRQKVSWSVFVIFTMAFAVVQFIPTQPVVAPAQLPAELRAEHRLLGFEGINNFRDLGGYQTVDGRTVQWGKLFRSGTFAHASRSDLGHLENLGLSTLIDFRSSVEKEEEPNLLPEPTGFEVVEIPMLDDGNQAIIGEVMDRIDNGDFEGFDPNLFMIEASRQFATTFTPQFKQFIDTVLAAKGKPIVWHCTAGKDRTGFASAILLRILGVPRDLVMADYMESKTHALKGRNKDLLMIRLFAGKEAEEKMTVLMGVEESWLNAAFDAIDQRWGSFDNYLRQGLELNEQDIEVLKLALLE
ncbi:MAG: tyrosine-protein phosphatase [Halioglobus sp.]